MMTAGLRGITRASPVGPFSPALPRRATIISSVEATSELIRGRDACAQGAWLVAYECLRAAGGADQLGPPDLELLATSAYMLGRVEDYVGYLERAYGAHLGAGSPVSALR